MSIDQDKYLTFTVSKPKATGMKRMGSRSKSQKGRDKEGQTEITITNVPVYDPWGHLTEVKYGQFGQMINGS